MDKLKSRERDFSARHHPVSGAHEARLAEQGARRAGGRGHRRADPHGRDDGWPRPQAQPQALAEVDCKAERLGL